MQKKKLSGGARSGAGRKKYDPETVKKKAYTVSLLPEQAAAIIAAHGSLTKAILTTLPKEIV